MASAKKQSVESKIIKIEKKTKGDRVYLITELG